MILRHALRIIGGTVITHHKPYGYGAFNQNQQLSGQPLRILGTIFDTQPAQVVEQLVFVFFGHPPHRILWVAGFAAGLMKAQPRKGHYGHRRDPAQTMV